MEYRDAPKVIKGMMQNRWQQPDVPDQHHPFKFILVFLALARVVANLIKPRIGLVALRMALGAQLPGFRDDHASGEGTHPLRRAYNFQSI